MVAVVAPPNLLAKLKAYFLKRGIGDNLSVFSNQKIDLLGRATDARDRAPWVPCARESINLHNGVGAGTMRHQIKLFFQRCAKVSKREIDLQSQILAATSHWLRKGSNDQLFVGS
jgi:hypothetical protein